MYVCMYVNIVHQDETLINNKTLTSLIITDKTKIIYSMYRAGEVSVH